MADENNGKEAPRTTPPAPPAVTPTDTSPVLRELLARVEKDLHDVRRRGRRQVFVLAILTILVILYTGWVTNQLRQIDSKAVAEAARGYVISTLPELQQTLRTSLIEGAPEAVDLGKQFVTRLPRLLRDYLQNEIPASTQALALFFEDELNLQLDGAVNGIADLTRHFEQETGSKPTLENFAQNLRTTYRGMILTVADQTYQEYSRELKELNRQLAKLEEGKFLSQKEKIEREIIEASLVLMDRYGVTAPELPQS